MQGAYVYRITLVVYGPHVSDFLRHLILPSDDKLTVKFDIRKESRVLKHQLFEFSHRMHRIVDEKFLLKVCIELLVERVTIKTLLTLLLITQRHFQLYIVPVKSASGIIRS